MGEFDDNGWNEILEAFSFGKYQIRSPNPDEIETNTVEDEIEFEEKVEAPGKHEITSAGLQKTIWDRRQLKLCDDILETDEYPYNDAIHEDAIVPTLHFECKREILHEDNCEDDTETDDAQHKFTGNANEEIVQEGYGNRDKSVCIEPTFTRVANIEVIEAIPPDYDDKNDIVRNEFTCGANNETMDEWYEDDDNNGFLGQEFTADPNYETFEEFIEDGDKNDLVGQKLTCDANNQTMDERCKDVKVEKFPDDGDKNDLVGQKFTCDANNKTMKQCCEKEDSNYSAEQKFTYKANDDDKTDNMDYCSARQKFGGYGDYEIIDNNAKHELKSPDKLQVTDKNWDSPGDAKTDMSCSENVPAESATALPAVPTGEKSPKNPQRNKSENKQRKIFHGISFFTVTIIGFRKASSIKILFQTACFVSGLFSCISGINAERVSPQDTLAFLGATVRFQCSWDLKKPVYWEWTSVHSDTGYFLYIGNGGLVDKADDRITIDIDRERGRFDLVITGVLTKHAGTYNCIENSGLGKSASAELTVFDNWNCSMVIPPGGFMGENVFNIPEDIMLVSCSVHFSGNKEPAIRWIPSKNVSHTNVTLTSKTQSTITTSLIMRPTKELDKSVFVAYVDGSVNFSITVGGQSWISDILTVNYVHLVNGPHEGNYKDDILCNPICSFAFNTVIYRYGDRNYELPLTFGDTADPKSESKWQIILILSIVFFVASLSLLLSYAIYARFKIRKNNVYTKDENTRTSESEKQSSTESEEFIKRST